MTFLDPSKWVDLYADYLFSYALMKTGSREQAEDLVQDTFLSAFKSKDAFRGESSEKTWLTGILKNKIIDYYRSKKPEQPFNDYLESTAESFDDSFFEPNGRWKHMVEANHISQNPESWVSGKEFRRFLDFCLMKMPERLRRIFVSKYIDEENPEEICKANEISSSNYWVIIFRAKVLLRACLEKQGITP